jgi:hypothetical protein
MRQQRKVTLKFGSARLRLLQPIVVFVFLYNIIKKRLYNVALHNIIYNTDLGEKFDCYRLEFDSTGGVDDDYRPTESRFYIFQRKLSRAPPSLPKTTRCDGGSPYWLW